MSSSPTFSFPMSFSLMSSSPAKLLPQTPPTNSYNELLTGGRRHLFETTVNLVRWAFPQRRWRRHFWIRWCLPVAHRTSALRVNFQKKLNFN
jgi:hypothetical protein